MPAVKVSVFIDEKDLQWLQRQAKRRQKSLSSVLTESVQQTRREQTLDEVLRWLDAPNLTLEELGELRRQWAAD